MARTRRLIQRQALCCALLASFISIVLFAVIMRALATPVWGVNGTTVAIQLTIKPDKPDKPDSHAASTTSAMPLPLMPQPPEQAGTEQGLQSARTYLPASQLTERPLVLQDIDPLLASTHDDSSQQQVVLRLLINEYGDVDQVLAEDTALPADLLRQLQQRFLQARFLPGRLLDRAVPSALRIAVSLQAMP